MTDETRPKEKLWGIRPSKTIEWYTIHHFQGRLRERLEGKTAGVTKPTWKSRKEASRRKNKQARASRRGNR